MDAVLRLCPCCRRPLEHELAARDLLFLPLPAHSHVTRPLLELLGMAWPRPVSSAVLVEHVYAGRHEPEWAERSVQTIIVGLRRRLAPYGWTISDGRQGGYRLERTT